MSKKVELLPCPWCGVTPTPSTYMCKKGKTWHEVRCQYSRGCRVSRCTYVDETLAKVTASWNAKVERELERRAEK